MRLKQAVGFFCVLLRKLISYRGGFLLHKSSLKNHSLRGEMDFILKNVPHTLLRNKLMTSLRWVGYCFKNFHRLFSIALLFLWEKGPQQLENQLGLAFVRTAKFYVAYENNWDLQLLKTPREKSWSFFYMGYDSKLFTSFLSTVWIELITKLTWIGGTHWMVSTI